MPSLLNRPNGLPVKVEKHTFGRLTLNRDNKQYYLYKTLPKDQKVVLDSILTYMDSSSNIITILGETLEALMKDTGYSKAIVRNAIYSLVANTNLLEPTHQLQAEYVVSPVFAFKGFEGVVWKAYQSLHYKQEIPMSVDMLHLSNYTTKY